VSADVMSQPSKPARPIAEPVTRTNASPAPSQPNEPAKPTSKTDGSKSRTLAELVERANDGDRASVKTLRKVLDEHPEIWRQAGNLAAHVEATWIHLAAEGNTLAAESIRRELDRVRGELLGPSPTPIEKLLVDQIVACWLQLKHAEITAGSACKSNLMRERFHDQRLQKSQRRYLTAMKTLAQIRRLPLSALMPAMGEPSALPAADDIDDILDNPPEPASDTTAIRIFPEREAV
jgi:hypothetical protein